MTCFCSDVIGASKLRRRENVNEHVESLSNRESCSHRSVTMVRTLLTRCFRGKQRISSTHDDTVLKADLTTRYRSARGPRHTSCVELTFQIRKLCTDELIELILQFRKLLTSDREGIPVCLGRAVQ